MLYKQNEIPYNKFPLSSCYHRYDPSSKPDYTLFSETGFRRFCFPHNHAAVEIMYVLKGEVEVKCDDHIFCANEGDIAIFNPFEVHIILSYDKNRYVEFQIINFDLELLKNKLSGEFQTVIDLIEKGNLRFPAHIPSSSPHASALARNMQLVHKAYSSIFEECNFMRIMSGMYGFIAETEENNLFESIPKIQKSSKTAFSQKVVQYINQNYASISTTKDISQALHLDKSYFCRLFHEVFNQNFLDYLHEYRIYIAKNLSPKDYHSLSEIAEAVGYINYNTFATYFKKYTGTTPKVFFKTIITNSNHNVNN